MFLLLNQILFGVCCKGLCTPITRREDIVAQDFFSRDVGMCLCFGGSKSHFLSAGMETLKNVMDEFKSTAMQAKIASMIVGSVGFGRSDSPLATTSK